MGVEILKKTNFTITLRYKIPSFSSVGPFFEEGRGVEILKKTNFTITIRYEILMFSLVRPLFE